ESTATPPLPISPHHIIPFSETRLRRAQISIRPYTPPPPSAEARLVRYISAPALPSPPPSPLRSLSSSLPLIPSPPLPLPLPPLPLPSPPLLLPSFAHRYDIPEADMSLQKRACSTTPTCTFEVRESSVAVTP
ncbi:hypothetical protein Tco_1372674, partial [Tanacetum coccineum]